MKIIFLSGYFPLEIEGEIISNSKANIQNAANTLQKGFIKGLLHYYPDLHVINLPFVGSFPMRYRKPYVKSCKLDTQGTSLSFVNLTFIKNFFIYNKIKKALLKFIKNNAAKQTIIIVYSIQYYYLKAVIDSKKLNPSVKIILIVPDLVEFMTSPKGLAYRFYTKRLKRKSDNLINEVDGFVLLAEEMKNKLAINNHPYVVIEGIYSDATIASDEPEIDKNKRSILYSGALSERVGVLELLAAFKMTNNEDFQLHICGTGECQKEIELACLSDSRIRYLGLLPRNQVINLQKKVTLLINPRRGDKEFTKYSFPSKTMEYFASATPTLMYRLPGIPKEYYNYCIELKSNEIKDLALELEYSLKLSSSELNKIGQAARDFIIQKKNAATQVSKIVSLIKIMS